MAVGRQPGIVDGTCAGTWRLGGYVAQACVRRRAEAWLSRCVGKDIRIDLSETFWNSILTGHGFIHGYRHVNTYLDRHVERHVHKTCA